MSTIQQPSQRAAAAGTALKVSVHDLVSSWLVALLIVIGFAVLILFLLWLTTQVYVRQKPVPVEVLDDPGGSENFGLADELEPPGVEELPDVNEPQLADTIEAITDAASTVAASEIASAGTHAEMGKGSGLGDRRAAGSGGSGRGGPERRINYITNTKGGYADQLDFFKVELGVIRPGDSTIHYAFNFGKAKPDVRSAPVADEKRSYFLWGDDEPMAEMDRSFLRDAGISIEGNIILQFWPPDSWQQLKVADALYAEANKRNLRTIRRTEFGVKPVGRGFEPVVLHQQYGRR